jgi:hypothetical protein
MATASFGAIDMTFFERHGTRDAGRAEEASMLFGVSADPSHFARSERAFLLDLELRAGMLDEWSAAIA